MLAATAFAVIHDRKNTWRTISHCVFTQDPWEHPPSLIQLMTAACWPYPTSPTNLIHQRRCKSRPQLNHELTAAVETSQD